MSLWKRPMPSLHGFAGRVFYINLDISLLGLPNVPRVYSYAWSITQSVGEHRWIDRLDADRALPVPRSLHQLNFSEGIPLELLPRGL